LLRALVGTNVGVGVGQLAFVIVVMPPLTWASGPPPPRLPDLSLWWRRSAHGWSGAFSP
jgi:hypothetical protein